MLNTNDFLPNKYQTKDQVAEPKKPVVNVKPPVPPTPTQTTQQSAPPSPPPAVKPVSRPNKKNNIAISLAVILLLGAGAFASFFLVRQNQDLRQQASVEDPSEPYPTETIGGGGGGGGTLSPTTSISYLPTLDPANSSLNQGCKSGWYACNVGCCGMGDNSGKRYTPILGEGTIWSSSDDIKYAMTADGRNLREAVNLELKTRGLINDNGTVRLTENFKTEELLAGPNGKKILDYCYPGGTLDTNKCRIMPGGYLYIGGSRDGDPCAPVLNGGGDWCAVIAGNGSTTEEQYCDNLGLIRCICNNGIGVIGSKGQSCDDLCGGTDNICESCDDDEPGDDPTGTPTVAALMCRRIDILDAQNTPLAGDADQSFVVGETELKFKCASSDNERVDHFEFQIIVPPSSSGGFSQTIDLLEDPLSKGISESYLIETAGNYQVQCRICESADSCQDWENNWTDTQYSIN